MLTFWIFQVCGEFQLRRLLSHINWIWDFHRIQSLNNLKTMSQVLKSRKNSKISIKRRESLIRLVQEEGNTIRYAAHKLNIKPSTAQQIMKKYKETGKVFCKIMNKGKKSDLSTVDSNSEPKSDLSEIQNYQEKNQDQQAYYNSLEQLRMLNENIIMQQMQQAYFYWRNLQYQVTAFCPMLLQ